MADTVGQGTRQRLVWLGLLNLPLLRPIPLPGMASAVGMRCLQVARGLCREQATALPRWLGQRVLNGLMLMAGYTAIPAVVASVVLLWQGSSVLVANALA